MSPCHSGSKPLTSLLLATRRPSFIPNSPRTRCKSATVIAFVISAIRLRPARHADFWGTTSGLQAAYHHKWSHPSLPSQHQRLAGVDMSFATQPEADRGVQLWTKVNVSGVEYLRLPLRTRWLDETDDLALALKEHLQIAQPGDTVAISEKVAILLTGRTVDISTVQPGRLARYLARHVHPRTDSKGLKVPEKMEYVVRTVGYGRIMTAAMATAVTRPLGMHGPFYRIAGSVARDVDGGRPPYEHVLFPPLDTKVAQRLCADLERALDIGVSIVDLNDYGGSIRAVSARSLSAGTLAAVLGDNPLGQRLTSTPFVLVRPA
jgi:hypothetical protein